MTPDELTECLEVLGWSRADLVRALDMNAVTAQRWMNGARAIPEPIAAWLAELTAAIEAAFEAHPPPGRPSHPNDAA